MAACKKEAPHTRPEEKIRLNSSTTRVTFLHKFAGTIGTGYLHLVGKTSFIQTCDHPKYLEYRRKRKALVYAFWHNAQAFLVYAQKNEGISTLVSQSKDGEYIAQVMKLLGSNAVRGSTSRGGEQALRDMCDLLAQGKQVGFSPDGPRGPLQTVHGGVIMAAQQSGAPIVTLTFVSRRKIVFNSWDKFVLPLPFSTIVVARGEPFTLAENLPLEEAKEKVRRALNENVDRAERALSDASAWGTSLLGVALELLYTGLATVSTPFLLPFLMVMYGAGRTFRFLAERFHAAPFSPTNEKKRVWLHTASIGEWQALKPVFRKLKQNTNLNFIVTVSTPEARVLIEKEEPDLPVRMMPLDLPWVLSRWMARVSPWAVVVVETELWPNMIRMLHKKNIPVFIINGRLSSGSFGRWRLAKPFIRRTLQRISGAFVRTELDGRRYYQLGVPLARISVTGNTKYDNLTLGDESTRAVDRLALFGNAEGVWVIAGSTWPGEEISLLKLFEKKGPARLRLILAPRQKSRFAQVAKLLESVPASWSYWSKVKETHAWQTDILMVDTLGDLKSLYRMADIAFVGGSLTRRGGQNPLEPAASGLPVLFGPSMENFHEEAAALKRLGAARQSRGEKDLLADIEEMVSDPSLRQTMGDAARHFVKEKQGAAERTAAGLQELLGL